MPNPSMLDSRRSFPTAAMIASARLAVGKESLSFDPTVPRTFNNLAYSLLQNQQPGDALEVAKRGIAKFPGEPYLYKNAGLASRQLGDLKGAFVDLATAVRLDSTFKEAAELREQTAKELAAAHRAGLPA